VHQFDIGDLVRNISLFPTYSEVGIILRIENRSVRVQWCGGNSQRGDYCYQSWVAEGDLLALR
jgi:hypothetical protein